MRVVSIDIENLEAALEAAHVDFAMGSFGTLSKRIRRQVLWPVTYVSAARRDHPRLDARPSRKSFARERHVVVSTAGTSHAHVLVERALEREVPAENIVCRVPTFLAAAVTASRRDAVVTLPAPMVASLQDALALRAFPCPVRLPRIDIAQHWHERFHREPGNQWIRGVFAELFKVSA